LPWEVCMDKKQIIENKLEIFLKEYERTKEKTERLGKIIETYAGRYHKITGQYYIRNDLDGEGYYK